MGVILSLADGWLVEVSTSSHDQRILFVAALSDPHEATAAVRDALGGLRCVVEPRCRLSPRALAQLEVRPGNVMRMRSHDRS